MKHTLTQKGYVDFEEFRIEEDPNGVSDPDHLAVKWAKMQKDALIAEFRTCWNMDDVKKLINRLENE